MQEAVIASHGFTLRFGRDPPGLRRLFGLHNALGDFSVRGYLSVPRPAARTPTTPQDPLKPFVLTAQFWAGRTLRRLQRELSKLGEEERFGLARGGSGSGSGSGGTGGAAGTVGSGGSVSGLQVGAGTARVGTGGVAGAGAGAHAPNDVISGPDDAPGALQGHGQGGGSRPSTSRHVAEGEGEGEGLGGEGEAAPRPPQPRLRRSAHFHIPFPRPMTMPREMQTSPDGGHLVREGVRVARRLRAWLASKGGPPRDGHDELDERMPVVDPDDLAAQFPTLREWRGFRRRQGPSDK